MLPLVLVIFSDSVFQEFDFPRHYLYNFIYLYSRRGDTTSNPHESLTQEHIINPTCSSAAV